MSSSLLREARQESRKQLTRGSQLDAQVLLPLARRAVPTLTLREHTAARLIASERSSGTVQDWACIVDAEVNRAARKGKTLTQHLTGGTGIYGPQGGKRPASTRQHANHQHLAAARAVLHGDARGIARGAERFFDPHQQDKLHRAFKRRRLLGLSGKIHSCAALGTLKAWSYDLPECGETGNRCCKNGLPPDATPGPRPDSWVGPIPGVDAYRLMLMAPSSYGPEHDERHRQAAAIIRARSGLPALLDSPAVQLFVLLVLSRVIASA